MAKPIIGVKRVEYTSTSARVEEKIKRTSKGELFSVLGIKLISDSCSIATNAIKIVLKDIRTLFLEPH